MDTTVANFNNTINSWLSTIDSNEYVSAAVSLFLILYAGFAAPQLPENIAALFDNALVKLFVFFLIAYSAKKNPTVALIAAIGLMVSLHTLTKYKVDNKMMSLMEEGTYSLEAEAEAEAEAELETQEQMDAGMGPGMGPEMEEGQMDDTVSQMTGCSSGCTKTANYRNSFYPQYVNMKPDAYLARYSGRDVGGYDQDALYSSM